MANRDAGALEVVRGIYEAYVEGDVEGFLDALAEDVTWTEPAGSHFGGVYNSPQEVLEGVIQPAVEEWDPEFVVEPERFIDAGETIVALVTERGTYAATSRSFECRAAHLYDLEDGQVVRFENFEDTALLQRAVQGEGA